MNQPYRTVLCALVAVAWLSLTSCTRNSTATKVPTAQSDTLSVSTTNSPPSITREAESKTSIAKNTVNSRSPKQNMQRYQQNIPIVTTADLHPRFNIPIAIPTYLPSGFYLREFHAFDLGYVGQDAFHYSITYEEVDNYSCLEISSGSYGTSFEYLGLSETSVKLSLGEVTVYSGNVEGKPMIIALDLGKQIGLPSSNYGMTLISGYDSSGGGECNPVSMEEFIQVLQSLKPLK